MLALSGESGKPLPEWLPCYPAGSPTDGVEPQVSSDYYDIAETGQLRWR